VQVFFTFTLFNTSNHNEKLKVCVLLCGVMCLQPWVIRWWFQPRNITVLQLGASSPEEAAKWIRSLQDAMSNSKVSPCSISNGFG